MKVGKSVARRIPAVRNLRNVYWDRMRKQYVAMSKSKVSDEKAVFFEAFGGRSFACSPKAIYLAMIQDPRFADWKFYWSFMEAEVEKARQIPELERATIVVRDSEDYFNALASVKYWVQNNRVPEFVMPRADQVYVQCWHGTPLKRLGRDVTSTASGALNTATELADRFALDASKWTYLLSPSEFTSQKLTSAFDVPVERRAEIVIEEGYPRNDSIVRTVNAPDAAERIAALKRKYGVPEGKKALLLAPTFREDQYTDGVGYTLDSLADFNELKARLGDEWVVMLRTHYYIANKFDLTPYNGFVVNVSDVDDINDLYCIADALCTDYSSVFFDYANTNRPIMFYWADREHYENELHGFYIQAETLPGPKCENSAQLADALAEIDSWFDCYGESYQEFRRTYCPKDDGKVAQRVVERVFFA